MEKLVKLLNEYNGKESFWLDEDSISGKKYINRGSGDQCFIDEHIISKKFGFIKWLVVHDKIDFEGKLNTLRFEALVDQALDSYYALLMLLSIQDEPIKFLIALLK